MPVPRFWALAPMALAALGCAGGATEPRRPAAEGDSDRDPRRTDRRGGQEASPESSPRVRVDAAADTRAPSPDEPPASDVEAAAAYARCGVRDARMDAAAQDLAERRLTDVAAAGGTSELLRLRGAPHPWPQATLVVGAASWPEAALRLPAAEARTSRRCGAGRAVGNGHKVYAVISAEMLAWLSPIPLRARTGAWLNVDARLLVGAREARVVVVGPDDAPRAVPTSLDGDRVRARFALDRPGRFAVQLVADVGAGARPLAEALVFADVAPFERTGRAPGEEAAQGDDAEALARAIATLRVELGLTPLRRNAELDALATAHAAAMRRRGQVAHDVGDGDAAARFERAGFLAKRIGENVARNASVVLAHRALYASPSHRGNLVDPRWRTFGVGVVAGDGGARWVVELFAE